MTITDLDLFDLIVWVAWEKRMIAFPPDPRGNRNRRGLYTSALMALAGVIGYHWACKCCNQAQSKFFEIQNGRQWMGTAEAHPNPLTQSREWQFCNPIPSLPFAVRWQLNGISYQKKKKKKKNSDQHSWLCRTRLRRPVVSICLSATLWLTQSTHWRRFVFPGSATIWDQQAQNEGAWWTKH